MDSSKVAQTKADSLWTTRVKPLDRTTDSIRLNFVKKYYTSYAGLNELFYLARLHANLLWAVYIRCNTKDHPKATIRTR